MPSPEPTSLPTGPRPLRPPLEFANLRLLVRDFAVAWHFYRDGLGLTPGVGDASGPYAEFLWHGEARLALFDGARMAEAVGLPTAGPARSVGGFTLILQTPDVDRAYSELLGRGVRFLQGPTDRKEWSLQTFHLRDPDGNVVEIYSELPR
ncbi:MAG: VOC family protein [Thermoplasmata archaeon]|nr:VOC family protein [Thermoplasmata archaeon]